ncbi:MAG TPA: geranylgeranyl reductase family protein [Nitrospirota bacterium]
MYDVIVTGAGPSGSTCARLCAQQGLKTLLLDQDAFPRSKPCAGAVSVRALSHLDFPLPETIIEKECLAVRVHRNGRSVTARQNTRFAVVVSRKNFDSVLAEKAVESGAVFQASEQVVAVHDRDTHVEVSTKRAVHEARFLVGADGVYSRVARTLRPPLEKSELALALVSQVPADDQEIDGRLDQTLDLYFGIAPLGYGWLFPHRGHFSAGIAGRASEFSRPKEALREFSQELNIESTDIRGHFIPLGGIERPVARGRVLLTGDAAGFADPFHGEGILYAILSGKLAAQAIAGAAADEMHPEAASSRYRRDAESLIRRQLRVAFRLAALVDKFPRLSMRMFFDHPEALQRYLDIPSGKMDYLQFQRWIIARLPSLLVSF